MTHELIICEKPSSAKKIAESLADGKPIKKSNSKVPYYEITRGDKDIVVGCAAGHLFTVAEKEKSFNYPSFDLEWKQSSEAAKGSAFTKPYVTTFKKLAKGADTFTVATDYDIEGEVIGYNIVTKICKQEDARRMKFSTLTKGDLIEAYENAQPTLNWGQANAGETRHFLDWIYGINLSRALMDSIKQAGSFKIMSIGRVQGPALKIIVDKEKEVAAFQPVLFWKIQLLTEKDGKELESWHKGDKFWKKDEAEWFFGKAKASQIATVAALKKSEYKQFAPNPFDLGTLQSEAYRHFSLNPKRTLEIAQSLYSSGFISYPRTSSQKLPAKLGYDKIIKKLEGMDDYKELAEELMKKKTLKPNEGKKIDPAHPSIYPTGTKPKSLDEYEKKVYDLIVKRFLATFGNPAIRETMTLELDVGGEMFITSGSRTVDPQWHKLYSPYVKIKEEELPKLNEGEELGIKNLELLEKETEPPKRYTPASLVKELEKRELGTKATRADIVDSLFKRGYVDEKSINATKMGMKTIETLEKYCPEILDEKLTRHFEQEMDKIRNNEMQKNEVIDESKKVLVQIINHFNEGKEKIGEDLKDAYIETLEKQNYIGPCPKCGEGSLSIRKSKGSKKRFAACDKYPDCETTFPLPQNSLVMTAEKQCEECNHPMLKLIRKGRRPQEACINPDCPTKHVDESEVKEKPCDKCKGGKLILRKSVYGSFLGCSNYPKCRNTEKIDKKEEKN